VTPYYQDDYVTLYHGDCREITEWRAADVVVTDPPYGVCERTDRRSKGRGNIAASYDFPAVIGDDAPFDPTHLLGFPVVVLFGANHFADKLPPTSSWLVWDKLDGLSTDKRDVGFDDNADVELAWSNRGGPARLVRHRWKGMLKASEQSSKRCHPTQKPVALMKNVILWAAPVAGLIADPYAGSGSTLRAAKDLGRKAIGIELDERYCEIAANRLGQEVLDFGGVA